MKNLDEPETLDSWVDLIFEAIEERLKENGVIDGTHNDEEIATAVAEVFDAVVSYASGTGK